MALRRPLGKTIVRTGAGLRGSRQWSRVSARHEDSVVEEWVVEEWSSGKASSLFVTSAAVAAAAAVGGAGTDTRSAWYRQLDKPSWQPPGPAFGIAWTILYVLLAGAGARALDRAKESPDPTQQRGYLRLYAGNLVLNAGWTWSFFRAKRPPLAVAEVVLLLASRLELTRRTYRLDRAAGTALLPYTGWTIFATALSAEIARRNRPGG